MTADEMTAFAERVRAFLDTNQIGGIVALHLSCGTPCVQLRDVDFVRVFSRCEVSITTAAGYDTLRATCDGFEVLAVRPKPMVLGPRVEVLP